MGEAETDTSTSELVVDVRSPAEAEKHGRIPGSVSLPLREMESLLELPEEQFTSKVGISWDQLSSLLLVTYCRSGPRAVKAAKLLQSNGYRCRIYSGSLLDWVACGGQIVTS